MSARPQPVVMIGCGGFARRYHVPALLADETLAIHTLLDPYPVAETHALVERTGARLVSSLADLPRDLPDAIALVTTPHTLHAEHTAAALECGYNVLVDKPFVSHASEARALADRAHALGAVNAVAYNRRFDRGCLRAREILRAGGIGAVRFVQTVQLGYERAGWFLVPSLGGGGPYTGRASHMADIVPWLLGRQPTALRSRLRDGGPGRTDRGGFIELDLGDLEWQATCIEEGWHMWDEVRIFGEDGLLELRRPLTLPLGWSLSWLTRRGEQEETLAAEPIAGGATRDFVAAVRTGSRPACTFEDAIPAVRIIERAFEAARTPGEWLAVGS
ncbi:MAG: Gfo/Idh/MocA family oxidoreductase [Ectothiorhodospiraceae bacterium]|nr:Gfo/Idh/MocA family oxidoreductase [Chromatiales bacterium]MCP5154087.1 Gfo/Idh/MocA family oxidoreductase [Ectothiorhodospiraceae bacterium]